MKKGWIGNWILTNLQMSFNRSNRRKTLRDHWSNWEFIAIILQYHLAWFWRRFRNKNSDFDCAGISPKNDVGLQTLCNMKKVHKGWLKVYDIRGVIHSELFLGCSLRIPSCKPDSRTRISPKSSIKLCEGSLEERYPVFDQYEDDYLNSLARFVGLGLWDFLLIVTTIRSKAISRRSWWVSQKTSSKVE